MDGDGEKTPESNVEDLMEEEGDICGFCLKEREYFANLKMSARGRNILNFIQEFDYFSMEIDDSKDISICTECLEYLEGFQDRLKHYYQVDNETVQKHYQEILDRKNTECDEEEDEKEDTIEVTMQIIRQEINELVKEYCSLDCSICGLACQSFGSLKTHFKHVHKKTFYVTCCKLNLHGITRISDHLLFHLHPDALKCTLCGKQYMHMRWQLENHKLKCQMKRTLKCAHCDASFD
ncbi:hypothetical protein DMENIID0001_163020 [Sergentomyia squamirostris]